MEETAGEIASEFILGELAAERALKSSLETRGSGVITTSGVVVTLLFGLAAVVTKSTNFVLPDNTNWVLLVAAALFIAAAVLGIVVNAPISYLRVDLDDIKVFVVTQEVWARNGVEVERQLTHAQLVELADIRRRNQTKGWLVVAAMSAQVIAILLTAIVVGTILAGTLMLTPTAVLYPQGDGDGEFLADTDWATGIVRMHFAYDAFNRLLATEFSSLSERDQTSVAAISHEGMHVLQMMNTGFAYELSLQCFQQVAKALRDHLGDLDKIYHHPHRYTAELEPVLDTLLTSNSDGVSALDLLEGSAYLFEKRIHCPGLGPRGFEEMLAGDVPDDVYSRAYNVATDALGDDAFDQFIHVATLALQTREPHAVFVPLLEGFRDAGSRSDLLQNHRIGLKLLNGQFADVLLGHPIERILKGFVHPILAPLVRQMNDVEMDPMVGPVELMAHPYAMGDPMARILSGLTMFPPRTPGQSAIVHVPATWEDLTGHDGLRPDVMLMLSAASSLLVSNIEPVPVRPPTNRPTRPAARYKPVTVRKLSFSPEHRTTTEQDEFERFIARVEANPSLVLNLRGTMMIVYPDFGDKGNPYLDSGVRRFLRGFYDRIPHLLYYLADAPDAASMIGCAAAHSRDADILSLQDGTIAIPINHLHTLVALIFSVHKAAAFARSVGDDPGKLRGHLRSLDPSLRDMLTTVLLDKEESDRTVGDAIGLLPPGFVIFPNDDGELGPSDV